MFISGAFVQQFISINMFETLVTAYYVGNRWENSTNVTDLCWHENQPFLIFASTFFSNANVKLDLHSSIFHGRKLHQPRAKHVTGNSGLQCAGKLWIINCSQRQKRNFCFLEHQVATLMISNALIS